MWFSGVFDSFLERRFLMLVVVVLGNFLWYILLFLGLGWFFDEGFIWIEFKKELVFVKFRSVVLYIVCDEVKFVISIEIGFFV